MAGAVDERVAPAGLLDDRPAGRSTSTHAAPARTAATPAACDAGHDLDHARSACRVGVADHRPCGSCPSSSRRPARRSRGRRGRPRSMRREPGRWCGFAPFGPDATIVSNDGAVGAEAAHLGVELEPELGLGRPVEQAMADAVERLGRRCRGRRLDPGDLALVLHDPQRLDEAARWPRARRPGTTPPPSRRCCAQVTCRPRGRPARRRTPRPRPAPAARSPRATDRDVGLDAGRGQLLGRLLARSGRR